MQTGEAVSLVRKTYDSKDYIEFLKKLDDKYSKADKGRRCIVNQVVQLINDSYTSNNLLMKRKGGIGYESEK